MENKNVTITPTNSPPQRGLHNWKNLFRKPNMYELVILFMLVMAILMAYVYKHDVGECLYIREHLEDICTSYRNYTVIPSTGLLVDKEIIDQINAKGVFSNNSENPG